MILADSQVILTDSQAILTDSQMILEQFSLSHNSQILSNSVILK